MAYYYIRTLCISQPSSERFLFAIDGDLAQRPTTSKGTENKRLKNFQA